MGYYLIVDNSLATICHDRRHGAVKPQPAAQETKMAVSLASTPWQAVRFGLYLSVRQVYSSLTS